MKVDSNSCFYTLVETTRRFRIEGNNVLCVQQVTKNKHVTYRLTPTNKDDHYWILYTPDGYDSFIEDYYNRLESKRITWIMNLIDDYGIDKVPMKKWDDIEKLDLSKIVLVRTADHTFYDANLNMLSYPIKGDYIDSIRENVPNDKVYAELICLLKDHPYVKYLSEEKIPYYNEDFDEQKGISVLSVLLPLDVYRETFDSFKKSQYPSIDMKKEVLLGYGSTGKIFGNEIASLLKVYHKEYMKARGY